MTTAVKTGMKKSVKKKWLAALRSGKYKQGRKMLRTQNDEFCCLGVLCEVARKEGVIPSARRYKNWAGSTNWVYGTGALGERWSGTLPEEVREWAGIADSNPRIGAHSASTWNDDKGKSFDEIADLIEEYL